MKKIIPKLERENLEYLLEGILAAFWVDFGLLILRMLNECSHVDKVNLL